MTFRSSAQKLEVASLTRTQAWPPAWSQATHRPRLGLPARSTASSMSNTNGVRGGFRLVELVGVRGGHEQPCTIAPTTRRGPWRIAVRRAQRSWIYTFSKPRPPDRHRPGQKC